MPIYVDTPMDRTDKWRGGCHLIADSLEELHTFANKLQLKQEWFQPKSWPHYDLTANKRKQAVMLGAIEITGKRAIEILKASREYNTHEC